MISRLSTRVVLIAAAAFAGARATEIGKPHSAVIPLTTKSFDDYLADPANGLWLLKFYAPWCGHCKSLAPVLDKVAPHLAGKMAIGKIDCTVEKSLCKKFNVRGYPTLKYYRDGTFEDYPLGRDADSIISFGEKMSSRAVQIVPNYKEAKQKLLNKLPVAFLVYDPDVGLVGNSAIDASGATEEEKQIEKLIQSTERTRIFGQVARKLQAEGSFGLLSPDNAKEEIEQFFVDGADVLSGGFIARIEDGVPIKIFYGEVTSNSFMEFVKENNLPVVIELGGHNFRFVGRRGKPLAIGVYDPEEEVKTDKFRQEMKNYAIKGTHKDEYIFGTMDGKKWDKFVAQFSITKQSLPELFVLDVPDRTYWQDSSVFGVSEFIRAVKNGEIESREQEGKKKGPLDEFLQFFVDYMPWSLLAMFSLFGVTFYLFLPSDGPLIPPPTSEESQPPFKVSGAELLDQLGLKVVEDDEDKNVAEQQKNKNDTESNENENVEVEAESKKDK